MKEESLFQIAVEKTQEMYERPIAFYQEKVNRAFKQIDTALHTWLENRFPDFLLSSTAFKFLFNCLFVDQVFVECFDSVDDCDLELNPESNITFPTTMSLARQLLAASALMSGQKKVQHYSRAKNKYYHKEIDCEKQLPNYPETIIKQAEKREESKLETKEETKESEEERKETNQQAKKGTSTLPMIQSSELPMKLRLNLLLFPIHYFPSLIEPSTLKPQTDTLTSSVVTQLYKLYPSMVEPQYRMIVLICRYLLASAASAKCSLQLHQVVDSLLLSHIIVQFARNQEGNLTINNCSKSPSMLFASVVSEIESIYGFIHSLAQQCNVVIERSYVNRNNTNNDFSLIIPSPRFMFHHQLCFSILVGNSNNKLDWCQQQLQDSQIQVGTEDGSMFIELVRENFHAMRQEVYNVFKLDELIKGKLLPADFSLTVSQSDIDPDNSNFHWFISSPSVVPNSS